MLGGASQQNVNIYHCDTKSTHPCSKQCNNTCIVFSLQNLMAMNEKEMKADQSIIQQLRTEMSTIQANSNVGEASLRNTKVFNPHEPRTTAVHSMQSGQV
jgi:hypothetical protein